MASTIHLTLQDTPTAKTETARGREERKIFILYLLKAFRDAVLNVPEQDCQSQVEVFNDIYLKVITVLRLKKCLVFSIKWTFPPYIYMSQLRTIGS